MAFGKLTLIVGPMYSGKTTELLNFAEIYEIGRKNILLFKPLIDERYSKEHIVTHKLFKVVATPVASGEEILKHYQNFGKRVDAVFVDEVHFFEPSICKVLKEITERGTDVYCAGLDTNYLWQPFETTALLLALADDVIKKKAVCELCGEYKATLSFKKESNGNIFDVGGKEKYIAVCKDCYNKVRNH